MNDRTEEAKALREFINDNGLIDHVVNNMLFHVKANTHMFSGLAGIRQDLIVLLREFGHIESPNMLVDELRWEPVSSLYKCKPSRVYRIKPGYELPDLTEVTPPRYKSGTWVFDPGDGHIWGEVVDRELKPAHFTYPTEGDWFAFRKLDGEIAWQQGGYASDEFQELPPMPDTNKLEAQGYRLTMKAADCSVEGHEHQFTPILPIGSTAVYSGDICLNERFNGWRWLVEKIEQESEEDVDLDFDPIDYRNITFTKDNFTVTLPNNQRGKWNLVFKPEGVE